MIKRTLWFFVFALMAVSCLDQPDCFSLNNNIVGITFRRLTTNVVDTMALEEIHSSDGAVTTGTLPANLTFINLPLNTYTNSTSFKIQAGGKEYDLTLDYSSKAQFVSEDCGEKFVITDLKASSLTFDSVHVAASTPKSRPITGTNIEVFRCPNTSRIKIRFAAAVTITAIQTDYASIQAPPGAVATLLLPLDTAQPQSTINFSFSDGSTRKLVLNYERVPDTLFHACGEQIIISELSVAPETNFSKSTVVRKAIQDPNQTNLEITL